MSGPDFRTGIGTDVHRLVRGTQMHLLGLYWPEEPAGLQGHSDGDAACHAMVDALLSAAGLGDIGKRFGTSDPRWAAAPGTDFLVATKQLIGAAGFEIVNVAVQVIGNTPRLAARRDEAQSTLSQALGAVPVNVSATTTDGLGLTGRGEGVAAIATALLSAQ